MAVLVHITEHCLQCLHSEDLKNKLENHKQHIIAKQKFDFTETDNLSNNWLRKKDIPNSNYRLIVKRETHNNHEVIIFAYCTKSNDSNKEKNKAYENPHYFEKYIDEKKLKEDMNKQIKQYEKTTVPLKDEERILLEKYPFADRNKDWVGETERWGKDIENYSINLDLLEKIRNTIFNLFTEGINNYQAEVENHILFFKNIKPLKLLLLVGISEKSNKGKINSIMRQFKENLFDKTDFTEEELNKIVKKQYDSNLLVSEEWIQLVNNPRTHLRLSVEEKQVLDYVRTFSSKTYPFPLFINGRAGSGKSTLLQYISADYIKYYLEKGNNIAQPVYFATNENLIKEAKETVFSILKANEVECNYNQLYDFFKVYYQYLWSLLPKSQQMHKFQPNKKITYIKFKKLFEEKFKHDKLLSNFSPDLAWYIIRSYIKGFKSKFLLTFEHYKDKTIVHNKLKTVSDKEYSIIFERVYSTWYKNIDGWDEQDLVRYVLDNNLIKNKKFIAIFCDEAQDFTRIEVELFLKMFTYGNKELEKYQINHCPIAFAGDEFQTINPTAFKWGQVRATFRDKLLAPLCKNATNSQNSIDTLKSNFQYLKNNYRSNDNIVKLCNTVQFYRNMLFKDDYSNAQEYWGTSHNIHIPTYYAVEDDKEALKKGLTKNQELEIIVPAHLDNEAEYVKTQPILSSVTTKLENNTVSRVYSPELIKGLEREHIIVYGFGEYAINNNLNCQTPIENTNIELEFFVNRLYVAVSRAKERLFIVDTKRGIEEFWGKILNSKNHQKWNNILNNKWNENGLANETLFTKGDEEQLTQNIIAPLKNAKRNKKDGLERKNPNLLFKAAHSFKLAQEDSKNREEQLKKLEKEQTFCNAYGFLYSENYNKAAKEFATIKYFKNAVECYWLSNLEDKYNKIKEITNTSPTVNHLLETIVTNFITNTEKTVKDYNNESVK